MVRFKNRYLLVELLYEKAAKAPTKPQILDAVRDSVRVNFGDFGHAVVSQVLQGSLPSASPLPVPAIQDVESFQ